MCRSFLNSGNQKWIRRSDIFCLMLCFGGILSLCPVPCSILRGVDVPFSHLEMLCWSLQGTLQMQIVNKAGMKTMFLALPFWSSAPTGGSLVSEALTGLRLFFSLPEVQESPCFGALPGVQARSSSSGVLVVALQGCSPCSGLRGACSPGGRRRRACGSGPCLQTSLLER